MQTASPRATVIACAAFVAGAALALFGFGPLDPPDGPISPTYKTLSEVEPRTAINAANTPGDADSKFKITKTGSYFLTGNITGVSGKSGIEVTANCTIDLGGFEMTGVNGSLDGILLVDEFRGTVRNGQVVGWGGNGIVGVQCNSTLFEDLYLSLNGAAGLVGGRDCIISRVRGASNKTYGITVDAYCTIVDCVGSGNTIDGIFAGSFSTVSRCNTRGNLEHGISSLDGGNISDCVSQGNTSAGIRTAGGVVRGNVCDANAYSNIFVAGAGGALVTGNTSSNGPGNGIYCSSGFNHVEGNLCKSDHYGIAMTQDGHNLVVRNYFTNSGLFLLSGNNIGDVLQDPGTGLASSNSWANIWHQQ